MKTNSFLTTDYTDYTDEELAFSYPCHPCYPRLNLSVLRLLTSLLLGLVGYTASAQVQQAWVARYNNSILNGTNQALKIILDSTGNIYITGFSQNTNGNLGYATIKYAPNGTQVWTARYDSTNFPSAIPAALVLDSSNNVVITGSAVTVKCDTNGNQLWTSPFSGTALAVDAAANVYVTGFGTNFNTEKLSSKGSNVWGITFLDEGPTISEIILVDNQTNIYVAGSDANSSFSQGGHIEGYYSQLAVVKYDSDGNYLSKAVNNPGPTSFVQIAGAALDSANSLYVLADFNPNATFITTMFSNNGVVSWTANPRPSFAPTKSHGLALDHNLNVLVMGQFQYQYQGGVFSYYDGSFKLNSNGNSRWTNYFPNPPYGSSVTTGLAIDQANNVYITGYSPGTNSGNDIVTIKYDNNGNQIWVQRYNGPGNGDDEGNAIAVDASGNVYVTGYETTTAGGTEMVTIKYAPSPTGSQQTNHAFLLQVQGEPGQPFDIQATTNFTTWLDLGQTNADPNGHLQFLDTNASLFNQRFYTTKPQ